MSTINNDNDEPLVAYVYGDTPPDFAALAAAGFEVVALDSRAPWYGPEMARDAARHGLLAIGCPMGPIASLRPTRFRRKSLA
jgi:hypothetical protein